jgi:hypothetical protein
MPSMTSERILALTGLVVALFLLARLGPGAWRAWRIFSGVKTRRMADAGPLEIPPPLGVSDRIADLHALGFSRIGERFIKLPGTPIRYEWLLGEASGEVYVSVVPFLQGALVSCYSSFDDGQWIQTNFPRGANVERPLFQASAVDTSVRDALAQHRSAVARLAAAHGEPRRVLTMADSLRMDDDYRRRHGGATLGAPMARIVAPAGAAVVLAVVCAALLVTAR